MVTGHRVGKLALFFYLFISVQAWANLPTLCTLVVSAEASLPDKVSGYLERNRLSLEPFDQGKNNRWDNWGVWDPRHQIFHRYAQTASTDWPLTEEDKSAHNEAGIRHFVSADGQLWYHVGIALEKGERNELAFWSGKTVFHNGQYYLFHTRGESTGRNQHIALSISKDGHRFTESKPVLLPSERWNYVFDDSDGAIPAWRDPEVFWDSATHCWTMLFATKLRVNDRTQPGFGVATSVDLLNWNLMPPLAAPLPEHLDKPGIQLELPNVHFSESGLRLFASYSSPGEQGTRTGALVWNARSVGRPLQTPGVVLEDPQYYGLSVVSGHAVLFLFSTGRHLEPYRLASLPLR